MTDQHLSELYRLKGREWVEADSAASLLEETKSANLSQMMLRLGDMPVSRAEMIAKGSAEYKIFVGEMVRLRKEANRLKVDLEWIRMRFQEQMSAEANNRREMGL